jgi:NTE family protein
MIDALVLGGGGVAGIAWMNGLLAGLADAGSDASGADLVIGTSAGAAVAAQLGSGLSPDELYARQVDPALQAKEIPVDLDMTVFLESLAAVVDGVSSVVERCRLIGQFALAADTVSEGERRAAVASRLPSAVWPVRRLELVAVDAETGEPRRFTNDSGVDLVDAVAASCAVPGVWPPVTIGGRRYVDGGVRSSDNADYAAGARRVLVVSPMGADAVSLLPVEKQLSEVVAELRAGGTEVTVISPDEQSRAAMGDNPLDPAIRAATAAAGRAQGRTSTV